MIDSARLAGRVAIVTGAGRGLGRSHALALAALGAKVVVNDLGVSLKGEGSDPTPAQQVVEEIRAAGGEAVASDHDVSDWEQASRLTRLALDTFGDLHVLVNNAGVLRDATLANMSEEDWDTVIRIHLKGHAAPTRHALAWWRDEARNGRIADRSVVMTSSVAGLAGNFGQANYASAKLAMLGLSAVVNLEGAKHGVRSNCISPGAATRMANSTPGAEDAFRAVRDLLGTPEFDPFDPGSVSGLVAWLADEKCPARGQILHISGDRLVITSLPQPGLVLRAGKRVWTPELLDQRLPEQLTNSVPLLDWSYDPEEQEALSMLMRAAREA